MGKYDYLKKYVFKGGESLKVPCNWFCSVGEEEIKEAEEKLRFELPKALKEFWLEIGRGEIRVSRDGTASDLTNGILPPDEIAAILIDKETIYMLYDYREELPEYLIPVFEIADGASFYFMRRDTDNPDAVYDILGDMLEPSLERFIWRLYHESPTYYLYINDAGNKSITDNSNKD